MSIRGANQPLSYDSDFISSCIDHLIMQDGVRPPEEISIMIKVVEFASIMLSLQGAMGFVHHGMSSLSANRLKVSQEAQSIQWGTTRGDQLC